MIRFKGAHYPFGGPHKDHLGESHLGTAYDPFGVYARLEHGGDFKATAKALAAHGYGDDRVSAPPVSDPWDGTSTLPVRPYRGRYYPRPGREVSHG